MHFRKACFNRKTGNKCGGPSQQLNPQASRRWILLSFLYVSEKYSLPVSLPAYFPADARPSEKLLHNFHFPSQVLKRESWRKKTESLTERKQLITLSSCVVSVPFTQWLLPSHPSFMCSRPMFSKRRPSFSSHHLHAILDFSMKLLEKEKYPLTNATD